MADRQARHAAYKAEGGQGRVEKQGEETAVVPEIAQHRRHVLGRHQYHERLAEVARYLLEHEAVVRVDDDEEGLARERIEIARVEAVGLLAARQPLLAVVRLALRGRRDAAQVVAH